MFYFLCLIIFFQSVLSESDISSNVFGDDRKILPVAFGDFNSDELTDVFIIRDEGKIFEIFIASEKEPLLRRAPGLRCNFTEYKVTSVVPGDFDGDAFMDILITTQNVTQDAYNSMFHDIRLIWGGEDKLNCTLNDLPTIVTVKGHPLAMDYNHDMIIDLFGVNKFNDNVFWIFSHNRSAAPTEIPLERNHEIKFPHSHSFLDINGDFTSDLLVTTTSAFEVWLGNTSNEGFYFSNKIEIPVGVPGYIGQALFLDVELTGKLYLLLPICYDRDCINSSIILNDDGKWTTLNINFQDDHQKVWGFVPPSKEMYMDTITIRGGDYNMDGYPDLLVTLRQGKEQEPQAFLLENVLCDSCEFKRTFQVKWNELNPFGKGTILSVFFDFYQDGVLDFILVKKNATTNEYKIGALKNNLEFDSNFMKVMVLTGLKNVKVPITVGVLGKKKGTYGTNLPGPRISYHTLSQEGLPRDGVCAQLPQSAYNVMNLPFSIFGLDRTPNFVDTLTVGLSNRSRTWNQLIPNSQVVVIPRPPDDPSSWKAQLFVTPSKNILTSVYVFSGICGLVTIFVLFLHYKEKRDDRLENLLNSDFQESDVIS